jgi:hypothetical protein
MTCPTCSNETSHIRVEQGIVGCHACMGFSETGGSSTDKILTRSSERVLEQQVQNEGDMITPYVVDRSTNQAVINQDFIDMYPNQAANTFSQEELRSSGNENLTPVQDDSMDEDVEFRGDEKQAIKEIVDGS